MLRAKGNKLFKLAILLSLSSFSYAFFGNDVKIDQPTVTNHIFDKVKQNNNWKQAFLTAGDAQVVFMAIDPKTNPKNEIGVEVHKFDQIIFVVEGNAKVILNGKETTAHSGDMIFVPEGTEHNVINQSAKKPLKILSVYSATDIPAGSVYKTKADNLKD